MLFGKLDYSYELSYSDGFSDDDMRLPVMLIKEQSFASAAVRACKSIVDGIFYYIFYLIN